MTKKTYAPGMIALLSATFLASVASAQTSWWRTCGGTNIDWGNSVQPTADGGYIVAGSTRSFGAGDVDVYLIKTNAQGDALWSRTYGGSNDDYGYSVQQTSDGGYIVAGSTRSFGVGTPDSANFYLIKTDASGDTLWARTYGGTNDDAGVSVQPTSDGGYIIAGQTWSFGAGDDDVFLVKTDSLGLAVAEPLTGRPLRPTRFLVQPNPFTSLARVSGHETESFVLSDVTGRQVTICGGDRIGEGLRPGVYLLSPVAKSGSADAATIIKTAR